MKISLENKTILVIGATSNVGKVLSKKLIEENAKAVLVGRNKEKLLRLKEELDEQCEVFCCDLENPALIKGLFECIKDKVTGFDGMVYCAGVYNLCMVKAAEIEDISKMMNVNALSFFECCKYFAESDFSKKEASIVAISSYAAHTCEAGLSGYAMSKSAMNTQVKVMAREFKKRKIRVNSLMPAKLKSKMGDTNNEWSEVEIDSVKKEQALGIIPIENLTDLILFFLSDASAYITGENIVVSAGYGM